MTFEAKMQGPPLPALEVQRAERRSGVFPIGQRFFVTCPRCGFFLGHDFVRSTAQALLDLHADGRCREKGTLAP